MKEKFFIANIIEASAGTGKTRYITEEMLSIYREYRNPEILKRIVAITFSEKAAIEMKERFLKKFYGEIFSDLSEKEKVEIENVLFKLQISTIHSYCQTLLRRFYFLSDIDPYFEIIQEGESGVLFNRAIYKVLNTKSGRKSFAEISKKFKLNHFKNVLFSFLNAHPHIFLGEPEGEITKKITSFYNIISTQHFFLKKEFSYLDFDDLEKLTYKTLRDNQDALVVLEDFDENINFIFIDEFQDTNLLQFEIVKKLIEEWISGYGAKVDRGENFGIIIVGDRKQSIYKFRGAESKLFDDAKEVLSAYMTEKVLTENYRSSKEIIDFVNNVFENESPWNIQKLIVSEKKFNLPSKIEIKLFDNKNEEEKKNEYKWVCQKIIEIVENKIPVIENDIERTIEFKDIAILLRQRKGKYFKYLERYLSDFGIPYVIIGGVGFYQEEEIIMLTSLLFALVDPEDKFSIWNIENSILYMDKREIEKLRQYLGQYNIVEIIENIFKEKNIWEKLNGQQKANCEKFLMILNQQKKLPLFQLTQNLREISERTEEPKADIFSIHQNAVKINTIHGSKGLEFPCVFLINIEDGGSSRKNDEIIYIREKGIYKYSLNIESQENFKDIYKREIKEEEKRLLYVALTRSSQYLFISGQKSKNLWVNMIEKTEEKYKAEEITRKSRKIEKEKIKKEKIEIPIKFTPLTSYTKQIERTEETSDMIFGEVIHKVLSEISNNKILFSENNFTGRCEFYLKKKINDWDKYNKKIKDIFKKICDNDKIKEIITYKNGLSEVPFVYKEKKQIFEGKIDKVIIEKKKCKVYDYKLNIKNPNRYMKQLNIYEKAVKKIFKVGKVEKYLISLEEGEIYNCSERHKYIE